jgi:hypothetical protein
MVMSGERQNSGNLTGLIEQHIDNQADYFMAPLAGAA